MYQLIQGNKVHESNLSEEDISDTIDSYDSLFHSLGFATVVSVSERTHLPKIKVVDNKKICATLSFRKGN
tara:strand:+ start:306 stop:515 length:210 start_codon:yes stop_codon:yes gene_type:complete